MATAAKVEFAKGNHVGGCGGKVVTNKGTFIVEITVPSNGDYTPSEAIDYALGAIEESDYVGLVSYEIWKAK